MKKLIVATLLVFSAFTFAQEKMENETNSPRKGHWQNGESDEIRLKKLSSELNLNAKQQEQIKTVMAEQKAKREAFMKEKMANKEMAKVPTPEERKERIEKFEEAKLAMDAKLKAILSPEQLAKWNTIKEERKDKMKDRKEEKK
ncbi:hypothetical protein [Flavobacterium sp.]|uniref:hypothetical protein n=1 Tax=Flavobacterium sp. TaxID=239 RepID=UPI0038FBEA52